MLPDFYIVIRLVFGTVGFPTKVQLISRKASEQYYINFPSAVAQAMGFSKGETVEWIVADKGNLTLSRREVPPNPAEIQKTPPLRA